MRLAVRRAFFVFVNVFARWCVGLHACLFARASVFVCVFVAWSLGVGGSALRVPPAETRLTVYRRLDILLAS